jgi:hypothetical protein
MLEKLEVQTSHYKPQEMTQFQKRHRSFTIYQRFSRHIDTKDKKIIYRYIYNNQNFILRHDL